MDGRSPTQQSVDRYNADVFHFDERQGQDLRYAQPRANCKYMVTLNALVALVISHASLSLVSVCVRRHVPERN